MLHHYCFARGAPWFSLVLNIQLHTLVCRLATPSSKPKQDLDSKWFIVHQYCTLWHVFHLYRYKAGVVASQLGLLAATGSVQCQRNQSHWIEEVFGYPNPVMYGTSGFEAIIDR